MSRRSGKNSKRRRKSTRRENVARDRIGNLNSRDNEAVNKQDGSDPGTATARSKSKHWVGVDGDIGKYIGEERGRTLQSYTVQPGYVLEHANHEQDTARGGYANRQLFELVQNSADALSQQTGRIEVRLTDSYLYCADSGESIDIEGVKALMFSYLSPKRGTNEIGRFGLGFKSVLGVSDSPEFFSRSGSFGFDRRRAKQMIEKQLPNNSQSQRYPVLRLPFSIDPETAAADDPVLRSMMNWANNIVRLPLIDGAYKKLGGQASEFPSEFLLFVSHVKQLDIRVDDADIQRKLTLSEHEGELHLHDEDKTTKWKTFHDMHKLSDEARADSRTLDDATEVPIWWAAPLEGANTAGHFWAFFPTSTPSLVPGIVNAPWKTNEDRQNLLPGVYNDELVKAAANLIANNLHHLSTPEDPAKHLDALPRRVRQVDEGHTVRLSDILFKRLYGKPILPDMRGALHRFDEIKYPPVEIVATRRADSYRSEVAIASWYGANRLHNDWLHQSATPYQRWPFVERLCDSKGILATDPGGAGTPVTALSDWLEALVKDAPIEHLIYGSKSAIRTATLIPEQLRSKSYLGSIVLAKDGTLKSLDSDIYLPSSNFDGDLPSLVHSTLARDDETREHLVKLGVKHASPQAELELFFSDKFYLARRSPEDWERIWDLASEVPRIAVEIIKKSRAWQSQLHVKTVCGDWAPAHSALLPGEIVPADGTRDDSVAIHSEFRHEHETILRGLNISDHPRYGWDLRADREFNSWFERRRDKFIENVLSYRNSKPQRGMLNFTSTVGVGPITVIKLLSEDGRAAYTQAVLNEVALFHLWTMRHDTRSVDYKPMDLAQPAIDAVRKYGRIRTGTEIVPFADALGENPKSREAQRRLLDHPNVEMIRKVFDLRDAPARHLLPINGEQPLSITEAWPGLERHLEGRSYDLIRCEVITDSAGTVSDDHIAVDDDKVIITHMDREDELDAIGERLNILLDEGERFGILNEPTPESIRAAREEVRQHPDDASRLLKAVGEEELHSRLPGALIEYYSRNGQTFSGHEVAQAAISTYHTGALREYRHALEHLGPPKRWAGSPSAIKFVTALGFSPEWAGESNARREPFLEVPGPIVLPPLHDYQNIVVNKLRQMLRSSYSIFSDRRAMISLPTGSGKTRIAVEGIVSSITEDEFIGGVLWVADRDELCEQSVQSWQEIWRAKGKRDQILRISRMWEGQPPPLATNENHVVVASVQTLSSKFNSGSSDYDFLRDFKLIVFDEAHRTIAATYTSVMEELGFRSRRGDEEPMLLGLTATPYRGYSESETRWLANRYGQNRLDKGAFLSEDANLVMRELQDMDILARATHEEIEGGSFSLHANEMAEVERAPWLPNSVEDRITRDSARTERIILAYKEHIGSQNDIWPTLIFATSVEHAQTLAAILSSEGITARAVSGNTDRYTRRQVVEQFRAGELKVLVNYGVFREGFDAPKTRAIIVARPVYSPNLYFQMIGRGLRGIKNGGNDRCLILDVNDNIMNFERNLAFTELDWLWD